jgi:hypothetical protein
VAHLSRDVVDSGMSASYACSGCENRFVVARYIADAVADRLTLINGVGVGLLMQSTTIITIDRAEARDMGAASGSINLWHTMGASLGTALLGALYTSRVEQPPTDHHGPQAGSELAGDAVRHSMAATHEATQAAVTNGIHTMAIGGAVLAAIAFILACFIRENGPSSKASHSRSSAPEQMASSSPEP